MPRQRPRSLRLEPLESRAFLASVPLAEVLYLSTDAAGTLTSTDGTQLAFDDSDVLRLEIRRTVGGQVESRQYSLYFDASDVGLTTSDEDLDALAILPDGRIVISTTGRAAVPGLSAEDEDLLLFTPAAGGVGASTAGRWSLYFDGSDVGLSTSDEDVDAVSILPDGRLVLSTVGSFSAGGITARGEDLLLFTPAAGGLGASTAGVWSKYFDGSDAGLASSGEAIDAVDIQDGTSLHVSTSGSFSAGGLSGADEDVATYDLATSALVAPLRIDGSAIGLAALDIDAIQYGEILPQEPGEEEPGEENPEGDSELQAIDVARVLSTAATKLAAHDARNSNKTRYAREAAPGSGSWATTDPSGWESGFYPGALWMLYEHTGDPVWRARAEAWTAGLEGQKNDTSTHDLGFKVFNSFGQGARLTGSSRYQDVVLTAARTLSRRFDPDVGAIRSWNGGNFEVIIDNLMNLELLLWSAKNGGPQQHYDMAVSHALKTLQNHVRANGSTYHVVDYSSSTGRVLARRTHQGRSDESTWSRGQGWAVYGFTMVYRETLDPRFLEAARRTADYFIDHLPTDFVPQADFDSTYTDLAHKDSSAAAIAASGLIELSTLETDPVRSEKYWSAASRMLGSLTSPAYFSTSASDPGLLLHGSRNYPGNNRSYMFGDYYLIEATLRYAKVQAAVTIPSAGS